MNSLVRPAVAIAAVLALSVAATALVSAAPVAEATVAPASGTVQSANGTTAGHAPGAHLAGVVGASDASVRGSVDRAAFLARLSEADGPDARARVVDGHLSASERRVATLEQRIDGLPDRAATGSSTDVVPSRTTARAASVGSAAAAERRLVRELDAAVSELPRDVREDRDLSRRVARLEDRLATLREGTRDAVRDLNGTNRGPTERGLATSDVDAAARRALARGGRLHDLFGSERIDLRVRTANGSTARFAVHTAGGELQRVEAGAVQQPTLRVHATEGAVLAVRDADDPLAALRAARDDGRVRYDGVGLWNSAKFGAVSVVESLSDLL